MKSCPICNRTFDDTMTFCLVDGSILSAPFDHHASQDRPASRNTGPARTERLRPVGNAVDPTRAVQNDEELRPQPPTMASLTQRPDRQAETFLPQSREPSSPPSRETFLPPSRESSANEEVASQPSMKTMVAPPPEVKFGQDQPVAFGGETLPANQSTRGKWLAVIAGGVLVVIIVGAIVWFIKSIKNRKVSPAQSQQAKQTGNKPPPSGPSFTENIKGTEIQMISVPGGTFLMGSPLSEAGRDQDEGPQNNVTIPNLYMSKYEVTQAQYEAVMNTNPSRFKDNDLPVDSVSWNDAVEFCRKLSQLTSREYRLPTEAEWEYADRAGTTGPYAGNLDAMTWYGANAGHRTHPVGLKQPNAFGLYDTHGNVWEWCQSKYKPYPYNATDGREDLQDTDVRVMRGGSWENVAKSCRSAYRRRVIPDVRSTIGFRIVLAR